MTVLKVWIYLIFGAVFGHVGFALLDGTWDNHPHTAVGWLVYLGSFLAFGLACSGGLLLAQRRREQSRPRLLDRTTDGRDLTDR